MLTSILVVQIVALEVGLYLHKAASILLCHFRHFGGQQLYKSLHKDPGVKDSLSKCLRPPVFLACKVLHNSYRESRLQDLIVNILS